MVAASCQLPYNPEFACNDSLHQVFQLNLPNKHLMKSTIIQNLISQDTFQGNAENSAKLIF